MSASLVGSELCISDRAGGNCYHRYFVEIHFIQSERLVLRELESFNGAAGLSHAARGFPCATHGKDLLLKEIRRLADAEFGVLQGRLRHPRQLLREIPWAPCFAWLRAASSVPCRQAVQPGPEVWSSLDANHGRQLSAWPKFQSNQCLTCKPQFLAFSRLLNHAIKPEAFTMSGERRLTVWG
jgi:hypothetical protein